MAPRKGEVNDLTVLPELTELGILEELQARYRRDIIYTNIGDILIAVNPYKDLSIYGPEIGEQYTHEEYLHTLPPHVYAVATRCNSSLWNNGLQQCILVSGESGAGKTESAKMLISQLVRCSRGHRNKGLEEQILEVNPLLEAFGNAETVMNNNSSRFGKLIEIIFSPNGSITGAQITEHMLEKCRAVGQSVQENNFHIFYYLLAGLRPEELDLYFLSNPERYRIVDPGHGLLVFPDVCNFTSCKAMLDGLRHTLGIVGFSTQDMQLIFGTLAAILHLTNIEFVIDPDTDSVIIINEDEIDYASVLLSVQPEDMVAVLLANISFVRGERIVNLKTVPQACDGRDALSKAIYSRLFSWIVQQINLMLCDRSEADRSAITFIYVLDMAGFENFLVNSFEQLCINVANEQFQSYFNNYVFHLELAEYEREGVKQPKIKFNDNQGILDLFLQRNNGLFAVLDDECCLAKMTDMTMVDKLNQAFVRTEYYRKSRHRDPVFTIAHYAGLVTYNAVGFLDKNRDTMGTNLKSLMENSHNKLITELFTSQILDTGTLHVNKKGRGKNSWTPPEWKKPHRPDLGPEETLSRRAGRKLREKMKSGGGGSGDFQLSTGANTASGYFRNSLSQLMVKISSAEPHFIRCIKPNGSKTANSFDPKLVLNQLHSTGVIETTRIRRLGYSTRLSFQEFLERYKFLVFPLTAAIQTHPDNCKIILEIFLKYWHVDELSRLLNRQYEQLRTVQRLVRGFLARQHFHRLRQLSFWCYRQVEEFSFLVNKQGEKVYDIILDQYNYDREKHQLMLAERANNQSRLNKGQIGQDSRQLAEELLYVAPDYEDTANRLPAFRQERGTIQPLSQDKRSHTHLHKRQKIENNHTYIDKGQHIDNSHTHIHKEQSHPHTQRTTITPTYTKDNRLPTVTPTYTKDNRLTTVTPTYTQRTTDYQQSHPHIQRTVTPTYTKDSRLTTATPTYTKDNNHTHIHKEQTHPHTQKTTITPTYTKNSHTHIHIEQQIDNSHTNNTQRTTD
ncbi:hypothetical protein ScPMuIL_009187 [Solemya velum]